MGALCEGCSSSSSGAGGGATGDAGASDAGGPRDAVAADHAAIEAGVADTGGALDAATDAGATCAPATSKGSACSACVASNCEAAWCTCQGDPTGIDDAGNSGCLRYVACAEDCVASDAGSPTTCLQQICSGTPLNPIEEHEGQTFIDCLVQYCDAECVE